MASRSSLAARYPSLERPDRAVEGLTGYADGMVRSAAEFIPSVEALRASVEGRLHSVEGWIPSVEGFTLSLEGVIRSLGKGRSQGREWGSGRSADPRSAALG